MTVQNMSLSAMRRAEGQRRTKLHQAYRDTFEELGDEAAADWRVRLLGRVAQALFAHGRAYRYVLRGALADVVLRDLNKFCFATRTTDSERVANRLVKEGRRQVWLRLQYFLRVKESQVWDDSEFNEEF